jgi:Na+-driven multidrug efflux pump
MPGVLFAGVAGDGGESVGDGAQVNEEELELKVELRDATTNAVSPSSSSSLNNSRVNANVNIPSYRALLVFSSTTILIWLSEPLLSLVDTAVVGMTTQTGASAASAVVQLASLGPATTLIDSLLYSTLFLAISTTNQLAPALAVQDYRQLQTVTSHVLAVAVVLGLLVTATVLSWGTPLLQSMAGSSASTELVTCAVQYSKIRAVVAVSSVVGMVAQSLLLTVRDMRTPAMAVVVSSVINIVGDVGLAGRYGVQGAAVATAAACVASTAILMHSVRRQMLEWRQKEVVGVSSSSRVMNTLTTTTTAQQPQKQRPWNNITITEFEAARVEENLPTSSDTIYHLNADVLQLDRQLSPETHQEVPLVSLPDAKSLVDLVLLSGPIFLVMVAKIACYGAMTLRCTDFGVTALASHNIMMRIFFFYGCFGDSISQTAQTFLPATLYPVRAPREFRQILSRLLCMAAVVGVFNSQTSVWMLRNLSGHLTKDVGILQMMKDHTGFFGLAILLHPFIMVCEGTVIAQRDFSNLIQTYLVTLSLHFGILWAASGSFPAVWRTFFLFQLTRLVNFGVRVIREQQRSNHSNAGAILL